MLASPKKFIKGIFNLYAVFGSEIDIVEVKKVVKNLHFGFSFDVGGNFGIFAEFKLSRLRPGGGAYGREKSEVFRAAS